MRTYSQYGEDRIAAGILTGDGEAVEVGAGDGVHLSNTALFRERGWWTTLVEPDPQHKAALEALESERVVVIYEAATPETMNLLVSSSTTLLSIDVDGDDIFLLEALFPTPEIIIIEYNPTMPWHVDIQPARLGLQIGASVAALRRVAEPRGYGVIAVTECNVIFHLGAEPVDWENLRTDYTVATEYFSGRPLVIGTPPWGVDFANPFPMEDVIIR